MEAQINKISNKINLTYFIIFLITCYIKYIINDIAFSSKSNSNNLINNSHNIFELTRRNIHTQRRTLLTKEIQDKFVYFYKNITSLADSNYKHNKTVNEYIIDVSNTYYGSWSITSGSIPNFEHNSGVIEILIYTDIFLDNKQFKTLVYTGVKLRDGEYINKWHYYKSYVSIHENVNINEDSIDNKLLQMSNENTTLILGELFEIDYDPESNKFIYN